MSPAESHPTPPDAATRTAAVGATGNGAVSTSGNGRAGKSAPARDPWTNACHRARLHVVTGKGGTGKTTVAPTAAVRVAASGGVGCDSAGLIVVSLCPDRGV